MTLFPTFLTRRKSSGASASSSWLSTSPLGPFDMADSILPPPLLPSIVGSTGHTATETRLLSGRCRAVAQSTSRLRCARCLADLALTSQIISKGFNGRWGRAFLVAPGAVSGPRQEQDQRRHHHHSSPSACRSALTELPNTYADRPTGRHLVTGMHTVADIGCAVCGAALGWKYLAAEAEEQRYKVGNFILEEERVVRWGAGDAAEEEVECGLQGGGKASGPLEILGEVEFDSADEDECEELFLGTWDRDKVWKRREERLGRGRCD